MCSTLKEMEWLRNCLTDTGISFATLFSYVCETIDFREFERTRHLRSVSDSVARQFGHFEICCTLMQGVLELRLSYRNLSLPTSSDIAISYSMLRIISDVLGKGIFFDFGEFFTWWVEANSNLNLQRNKDLAEVVYQRPCRRGPQKGVVFRVSLTPHCINDHNLMDEVMIFEYQPLETRRDVAHHAG